MLRQLKLMSAAHGRGARYISKRKCLYIYIYFCVCVSHFSLLLLHGRDGGGWYTQEMSAYRRVITVILPGPEEDGNLTEMVTSLSETVSLASSIYSASVMSSASASYCLIMTLSSPFFLSLFYFCFFLLFRRVSTKFIVDASGGLIYLLLLSRYSFRIWFIVAWCRNIWFAVYWLLKCLELKICFHSDFIMITLIFYDCKFFVMFFGLNYHYNYHFTSLSL